MNQLVKVHSAQGSNIPRLQQLIPGKGGDAPTQDRKV